MVAIQIERANHCLDQHNKFNEQYKDTQFSGQLQTKLIRESHNHLIHCIFFYEASAFSLSTLYLSFNLIFSLLFIVPPSYNLTMDSRTQTNKTLSLFALLIPHSCSLFSKDKAGYCTCSPMFWLPCLHLIPSNSLSILCFLVLNGQRQVNNQWKIMFIGLR